VEVMAKQFNSTYQKEYYKDWIYLGTVREEDYYIQSLPTEVNPYPCTSIVYGYEGHAYISTTLSILDMLNTIKCNIAVKFYVSNPSLGYMLHMIAFVRAYAEKQGRI
jgi:hypothetical protein